MRSSADGPVRERVGRHAMRTAIRWLRGGYADGAPSVGFSPLIALNGPIALSPDQCHSVLEHLVENADDLDIEIAIMKTTDRLPAPGQSEAVRRLVRNHTAWHGSE